MLQDYLTSSHLLFYRAAVTVWVDPKAGLTVTVETMVALTGEPNGFRTYTYDDVGITTVKGELVGCATWTFIGLVFALIFAAMDANAPKIPMRRRVWMLERMINPR